MCGRTACTLDPDSIVRACRFNNRRGRCQRPVWRDPPGGQQYYPSHNVAPASHTPVLLSSKHFPGELESFSERVVQPMKWGLVPPWHRGDPYKLEYETNNCRFEGMLSKKTFKTPLEKGNRCVILADGFFEWKRSKESKQPYFIYFPENKPASTGDIKPKVEPKANPTKPGLDDSKVKQESASVKPDPEDTKVKQESVYIKPDPDAGDVQPDPAHTKVKQEPVCIKPDPDCAHQCEKQEIQSSPQKTYIKEEQPCASSSATASVLKEEVETKVKMEPAESCDPAGEPGLKSPMKSHLTEDLSWMKINKETVAAEEEEWQGKRLLTMAGVFDVWHAPDGAAPLYSYSVITVDASPAMSHIHHRMPAILSTEEEVSDWLDFAEVPLAKAMKALYPKECVSMHMVSPTVNNSRNKSPQCVEPYDPKQVKRTASSNLMMNWLKKAQPAAPTQPEAKRRKGDSH